MKRVPLKELAIWPPVWTQTGQFQEPPGDQGTLEGAELREPSADGIGGVRLVNSHDGKEFQAFYRIGDADALRDFHQSACELVGGAFRDVGEIEVEPGAISQGGAAPLLEGGLR